MHSYGTQAEEEGCSHAEICQLCLDEYRDTIPTGMEKEVPMCLEKKIIKAFFDAPYPNSESYLLGKLEYQAVHYDNFFPESLTTENYK